MTLIVGHRGNPALFPDNSLEGFLSAREVADMAETDVRRTADGVAVLSHDPVVAGVTIFERSFDELVELDIGAGHHLVRFDELLGRIGDFPINIEVKNHPTDADYDPTFRFAVEAARRARDIDIVTCFDWPTMEAIRSFHPSLRTGLLVDRDQSLRGAIEAARGGGHRGLSVHWTTLGANPEMIAANPDLEIFVWTVNDPAVALTLADEGVTGIISDDPAAIGAAVQETR